jgi:hypothetical protein
VADVIFDNGIDAIVQFGAWGELTIGLFLKNGWTPALGDGVIADATSAGATEVTASGYTRQSFVTGTITADGGGHREVFAIDTVDFGTIDSGADFDTMIVAAQGSDDTDAKLIIAYDLGAQTTDGSDVTFVPDTAGVIEIVRA